MAFCAPAEMGELQAVEKMLKKPIPVIGGAAWSAAAVAAAPKPVQGRGQRPQGSGRPQGGKPHGAKPSQGAKPVSKPQGKPQSARPAAPRRAEGAKLSRGPQRWTS